MRDIRFNVAPGARRRRNVTALRSHCAGARVLQSTTRLASLPALLIMITSSDLSVEVRTAAASSSVRCIAALLCVAGGRYRIVPARVSQPCAACWLHSSSSCASRWSRTSLSTGWEVKADAMLAIDRRSWQRLVLQAASAMQPVSGCGRALCASSARCLLTTVACTPAYHMLPRFLMMLPDNV